MTVGAVKKLPIILTETEALDIYKKLAKVNKLIGQLSEVFRKSIVNESIISVLSYNESVQSTRIEGTQVTFHEIMEIQEKNTHTWQQKEVLNYREAIQYGTYKIREEKMMISTRLIKELHKILMNEARGSNSSGGEFRKIQNFIGPDKKIENASYIPIGADQISEYMTNLEFFINGAIHESLEVKIEKGMEVITYDTDVLLKIAVAHAQFESIHPFLDGNGRLGRILIALMALQEKLIDVPLFFVSEELERERIRYYNNLNNTRGDNPHWYSWIMFFLNASERMANSLMRKLKQSEELAIIGLKKCRTEAQKAVWLATFHAPIATIGRISELSGKSYKTVKTSLDFFVEEKMLDKELEKERNVKYYNYDLLEKISN